MRIASFLAVLPLVVFACVGDDPETSSTNPDGGVICPAGQNSCGTRCVAPDDVTACGPSCIACPVPPNGNVACVDGACRIACNAGFSACDDKCFGLDTDSQNCGRCGRSCGGTACNGRRCAVKTLATITAPANPVGLAVGTSTVYVRLETPAPSGTVDRVAKDGTGGLQPIFMPFAGWQFYGEAIATSGDDVFFTAVDGSGNRRIFQQRSGLSTAPTPRGTPTCGGGPGTTCVDLATDGTGFAWSSPQGIEACTGACSTTVGQAVAGISGVAFDGTMIVYAAGQKVVRCPNGNCAAPADVFTTADPGDYSSGPLAMFGGSVYWVNNSTGGADKARVLTCPVAGCVGAPRMLVSGEFQIAHIAVDAGGVYFAHSGTAFTQATGVVKVCRDLVAGCGVTSEILADLQPYPTKLALDATSLYFIAEGIDSGTGRGVYRIGR